MSAFSFVSRAIGCIILLGFVGVLEPFSLPAGAGAWLVWRYIQT